MSFQEFPKALYRAGDYMAVANADDEAAHRADGWAGWHEDQARSHPEQQPRKTTRTSPRPKTVSTQPKD